MCNCISLWFWLAFPWQLMAFSKFSCLLATRIISLGKYLLKFFANLKIRMLVFITELQEFSIRYKFLFRYDLQILFYILRVAISDFLNLVLLTVHYWMLYHMSLQEMTLFCNLGQIEYPEKVLLNSYFRTSLAVQWLRLWASTAGGMGSIPGWRTKILHASK